MAIQGLSGDEVTTRGVSGDIKEGKYCVWDHFGCPYRPLERIACVKWINDHG